MTLPTFSFLTTFYNAESTLSAAIDSSLKQKFEDWEHILVDDGSEDSSADVASGYVDNRVLVFQPGKIGRAKALNYGLSKAKGKYIAILDADDVSEPARLEKQLELFQQDKSIDLVFGNANLMDKAGKRFSVTTFGDSHNEFLENLMCFNPPPASTVTYKKQLIERGVAYNERCPKSIDFNFYLSCLSKDANFKGIREAVVWTTYTHDSWGKADNEFLQIRYAVLGLISLLRFREGSDSFFDLNKEAWASFLSVYNEWFEKKPFIRQMVARSLAQKIRTQMSDMTVREICISVLDVLRTGGLNILNRKRPISFHFPKDAELASNYFRTKGY